MSLGNGLVSVWAAKGLIVVRPVEGMWKHNWSILVHWGRFTSYSIDQSPWSTEDPISKVSHSMLS